MVGVYNLYPEVVKVCRPLIVEDDVLKILSKKIYESLSKSLIAEFSTNSTIKCSLTHVTDFPNGTEKGTFIGLDFSGRIFRLVHVALAGDRTCSTISKLYKFPDQKPMDGVVKTAEYVARCVNNFLNTYCLYGNKIILGVASTFPMEQECLQEAKISNWNKEFDKNELNEDFFMQLKISLKKYKTTKGIYLVSVVSNSTAALLSGLYRDPLLRVGVCIGENTNITYIEKFENMTTFTGDGLRSRTAVSVGLKQFADNGNMNFLKTEFDTDMDYYSKNPGEFVLEKFVSAPYLGEVARLCIRKLASMGVILNGFVSPKLDTKESLTTNDLAMMDMDSERNFIRCRAVMFGLGYPKVSDSDCVQIRFVSRCVARRSANLMAACLAAVIQKMENKYVHLIGDGTLLRDFPKYQYYLVKKINQLKKTHVRFVLTKGDKDNVGVGAGLVAHIYRDGFIRVEDKHRALPPFNANKYDMVNLPASMIDCDCEPGQATALDACSSFGSKRTSIASAKSFGARSVPEAVLSIPFDCTSGKEVQLTSHSFY